jgi:hypothetical protein
MLPTIIEDYIKNLTNKNTHIERRQFYYVTLLKIRDEVGNAIAKYEKEKSGRK